MAPAVEVTQSDLLLDRLKQPFSRHGNNPSFARHLLNRSAPRREERRPIGVFECDYWSGREVEVLDVVVTSRK